jgi:hypothetical protein
MSDFTDQVRRFSEGVRVKSQAAFVRVVELTRESIVDGSALTGAPGQPVDTGYLKASWQTVFESPTSAVIGTNTVYAPAIEDGVGRHGPLTLRSQVGGFHSVAQTRANFPRIVVAANAETMR